jgi:hypothetical protein
VFVSYAQVAGDTVHGDVVRRFWEFLRSCGIDARLDLSAAAERRDWALWMGDEIRSADYVLVIASRAYRERAEGRSDSAVGRGVQWEARLIRDAFYGDQSRVDRFVPVVLPGETIDGIPDFLAPVTSTVYQVSDFTVAGAEELLRFLTRQPGTIAPDLGPVPELKPRSNVPDALPNTRPTRSFPVRPAPTVHNQFSGTASGVVIQAGHIGSVNQPGTPTEPPRSGAAGVPGWRSTFQRLLSRLRQRFDVGEPITELEWYGPGLRWEFDGVGSSPGWVLCALPDGRAAAVAGSVWEGAHRAGGGALSSDPLDAIGFPVAALPDDRTPVIVDDDAMSVDMDGGTWGPGLLVRSEPAADWEWLPKPDSFSREMTRAARNWTGGSPTPTWRIRVVATTHVARSRSWEITAEQRRHFEAALPNSDFAGFLVTLAQRRGVVLPPGTWDRGPNRNNPDRASYSWTIAAPNGDLAAQVEVLATASGNGAGELVTCAELRIYDVAAWTSVIAGASLPAPAWLTVPDLRDLLVAAWRTATVDLLDLFTFPTTGRRWRGVPTVEFRLSAEHDPTARHAQASLTDLIDFAAFGPGFPDNGTEMAVTIPAASHLTDGERQTITPQALAYLGRNFGYLDATADQL